MLLKKRLQTPQRFLSGPHTGQQERRQHLCLLLVHRFYVVSERR